jgi:uncharacterized protein (DUF58 family)
LASPVAAAHLRAQATAARLPPLIVEAERVANTVMQGVHGRRRSGHGDAFWQFRAYSQGDAASSVDWRQSAKADRLFVRETEWEAAQTVLLWRDPSPSMRWKSDRNLEEKAARADLLLLALASLLLRGQMLQILDPAEESLPYSGRIRFDGLEGEAPLLVPRVETIRGLYAERLAAHRDGIATMARAAGWGFSTHRTDQPPHLALLSLWQALAPA